jgi:tetratricopeptide (TPR) repeat protein
MDLHLMIGLIGLLYILVFGGMSLLRREGLSMRFALESVVITALAVILVVLFRVAVHPVIFLLVLYLITLRIRILVDFANYFARRGSYAQAEKIYNFADAAWPDQTSKNIVAVNRSILLLQENKLDESIASFNNILNSADQAYLGMKYESALHFNLGVAYLRKGNNAMASAEFNSAIDAWPGSLYAHRAQQALDRQHHKESPSGGG